MATPSSTLLQKHVEDARGAYIQQMLGKARAAGAGAAGAGAAGAGAGAGARARTREISCADQYNSVNPGIPTSSAHLKQKIDAMQYELQQTVDRFEAIERRQPQEPCPPEVVLYNNVGEPIPRPRFPCNLVNNMWHE